MMVFTFLYSYIFRHDLTRRLTYLLSLEDDVLGFSYGYQLQDPVIRYQLLKIDVVRRWDSDAVDVVLSLSGTYSFSLYIEVQRE
nr:hypothetical protein [Tanacetum cinerariifolium]